jgi:hypothetical protein
VCRGDLSALSSHEAAKPINLNKYALDIQRLKSSRLEFNVAETVFLLLPLSSSYSLLTFRLST